MAFMNEGTWDRAIRILAGRHDFSRWIEEVFRDRPLAAHLRHVEAGVETDNPRDVADSVAQAIRGRYETAVEGL